MRLFMKDAFLVCYENFCFNFMYFHMFGSSLKTLLKGKIVQWYKGDNLEHVVQLANCG